ncbi:MAG: di-heme oxidoredictase family protein [Candidatus Thiodiazotropha sp.]
MKRTLGVTLAGLCLSVWTNLASTAFLPGQLQRSAATSDQQPFEFVIGKSLFERVWVSAPATTRAADGLGPLYNARSCSACHPDGGRGRPPANPTEAPLSLILKLDIPQPHPDATHSRHNNRPEPVYGLQLQNAGVAGHPAEAHISVHYREISVDLSGGETVYLRQPVYELSQIRYGDLHPQTRFSPRLAPQLAGMGLLDAISMQDLLARADARDLDGDGISGRVNWVWSRREQRRLPGRFGHKAGLANLDEMTQSAFLTDLGLSTPLYPEAHGDCTERQTACRDAIHGAIADRDEVEVPETVVAAVHFYLSQLAPPASARREDVDTRKGRQLFDAIGCSACHAPRYDVMHNGHLQPIHPYSDLLLHDLGDGLADQRPEAQANGREWRTAPLWGMGRASTVHGAGNFLHDGRARTLLEAILWHAGEALPQRDAVAALPAAQRGQLLRFLESL